ncbi:5-formyltetrahydrofolate cyclo-ligase [Aurantiacibacter poecillastricola]|uniref:5-formyltetrahydrofolate cyclo-ligase n=1 Tax=Aurantiacibacter poecillastricola TaxID=3064385 RepID=UPI00273F30C0|nr:5-formyltetrahydrofolate cyclo-ligase [Aurantiacibacter sp. 219JJ12-13]MDP5261868.1 5-formyltetrahydrofolate cyclo-ligase [Aurantiacibacter sp. 219JJ12-13]
MSSISEQKAALRKQLRKARREHAAALPKEVSALVFRQPPAPIRERVPENAIIGLYRADTGEAPAASYARHFLDTGHTIALPRIGALDAPMTFHRHTDPYDESDLVEGPMGLRQPSPEAEQLTPDVLFMPLVGFTERGERIGQGGGFYDRWLAAHPATLAFGLAWDVQKVDELPIEEHDMPLSAIITPTRIYGPF